MFINQINRNYKSKRTSNKPLLVVRLVIKIYESAVNGLSMRGVSANCLSDKVYMGSYTGF